MGRVIPFKVEYWEGQLYKSDRASAIVGAALLDEELENLLRSFFVDKPKVVDKLIRDGGPMGSFGMRIRFSYALGLLPETIFHDLKLVQKVRNFFAHTSRDVEMNHKKLAGLISSFKAPEWVGEPEDPDPDSPRGRFHTTVRSLLWDLASTAIDLSSKQRREIPEDFFPFGDRDGI
ncbi:MAG: MltR family transcriptional regulator [Thermodesulfobacteriota bacterium]|nr:MltR family transcriptional regulator [Thermodesulfobacteriota bacterium]